MNQQPAAKNTSGQGANAVVPPQILKEFNWGAFCFTWIWGLFNKSYITLICIPVCLILGTIPVLGQIASLGLAIWFGMSGNKWAWQNKRFNSIEEFEKYQKKWAIASVVFVSVVFVLLIVGMILAISMPAMMMNNPAAPLN